MHTTVTKCSGSIKTGSMEPFNFEKDKMELVNFGWSVFENANFWNPSIESPNRVAYIIEPRGNCHLEMGRFQAGHFEKPCFPCSELLRFDLTHL